MSLFEYLEQGGVIGYIILLLGTLGFSLMIFKFITLEREKKGRKFYLLSVVTQLSTVSDIPLAISMAKNLIDEKMVQLESGLSTIRIIAAIAPLLGLLGTVVGILQAFEQIAQSGLGNPGAFAGGISLALITTVLGLVIAIPHYIGYNYLIRNIDSLESTIMTELDFEILKR